jgi:hypothetical protein
MVSATIILLLSFCLLFLVWNAVHTRPPEIRRLEDWEANRYDVDIASFRMLVDCSEELQLRHLLSLRRFRFFQRKRLRLASRMLQLVAKNTAMLMKVGQLAKTGTDPVLVRQGEELIAAALRLRVNLILIQTYLFVKWMFPGWTVPVPACEARYRQLLHYLVRVRQPADTESLIVSSSSRGVLDSHLG